MLFKIQGIAVLLLCCLLTSAQATKVGEECTLAVSSDFSEFWIVPTLDPVQPNLEYKFIPNKDGSMILAYPVSKVGPTVVLRKILAVNQETAKTETKYEVVRLVNGLGKYLAPPIFSENGNVVLGLFHSSDYYHVWDSKSGSILSRPSFIYDHPFLSGDGTIIALPNYVSQIISFENVLTGKILGEIDGNFLQKLPQVFNPEGTGYYEVQALGRQIGDSRLGEVTVEVTEKLFSGEKSPVRVTISENVRASDISDKMLLKRYSVKQIIISPDRTFAGVLLNGGSVGIFRLGSQQGRNVVNQVVFSQSGISPTERIELGPNRQALIFTSTGTVQYITLNAEKAAVVDSYPSTKGKIIDVAFTKSGRGMAWSVQRDNSEVRLYVYAAPEISTLPVLLVDLSVLKYPGLVNSKLTINETNGKISSVMLTTLEKKSIVLNWSLAGNASFSEKAAPDGLTNHTFFDDNSGGIGINSKGLIQIWKK